MSAKPTGTFVWADLLPDDQARAIRFYSEVAGWTAAVGGPEFGGYALAFGGGQEGPQATVAGINPSISAIRSFREQAGQSIDDQPAMSPTWTVYLATDDIDGTIAAVLAAGGVQLQPRMDIPTMGSSALVADPTGAPFGLWQAAGHDGFGLFGEPGGFAWAEVYSTDAAATRDFFVAAFGHMSQALSETDDFTYFQLTAAGHDAPTFGVMQMPESKQDQRSHFGAYIYVSGVDAAAERAAASGGSVALEPHDSPFGRIATLIDSEGVRINLVDPPQGTGSM